MILTHKHKYFIFFTGFIIAFYLVITADFPTVENHVSYCMIHHATGYPCPACGTGRAMIFLRYGEFYSALLYNPLAYILLVLSLIAIVVMIKDLIKGERKMIELLTTKVHPLVIIAIFIFTVVNGIWNIYKGV